MDCLNQFRKTLLCPAALWKKIACIRIDQNETILPRDVIDAGLFSHFFNTLAHLFEGAWIDDGLLEAYFRVRNLNLAKWNFNFLGKRRMN